MQLFPESKIILKSGESEPKLKMILLWLAGLFDRGNLSIKSSDGESRSGSHLLCGRREKI